MARHHNRTGRSKGKGQFMLLPYDMVKHSKWRDLSGNALKVWIELRSRYTVRGDGSNNNGEITLSLDEASRILHIGKATVHRALKELQESGFVVKKENGYWYGRKASLWRVTDCPTNKELATKDWKKNP